MLIGSSFSVQQHPSPPDSDDTPRLQRVNDLTTRLVDEFPKFPDEEVPFSCFNDFYDFYEFYDFYACYETRRFT